MKETLKLCLKDLPERFQHYIRSEAINSESLIDIERASIHEIERMAGAYTGFFRLREMLTEIVNRLEAERRGEFFLDWQRIPITMPSKLLKDENGFLYTEPTLWQDSFNQKIDSSRLRICRICRHIFWAKREDSETCSTNCANNLRVRRSRSLSDEEKLKRKMLREENRNLVKQGKVKTTKRSKK
jgi:hypothetical protein